MNVPGRTSPRATNARFDGVHVTQTSLSRSDAFRSVTASTGKPSVPPTRAARALARSASTSITRACASGSTAAMAASWISPCTPQPTTVATRDSGRARYFAATAVAAPVRSAVMLPESITASGSPWLASNNTTVPWIVGRPNVFGFSGKFALVLAAK